MGSAAHPLFLSHTLRSGKLVTIPAVVRRAVAALITPIAVSLALACLVHGNSTLAHRGAVQALDSRPSILIAHLDKAEALASSRLAISDDCAKGDWSDLLEEVAQILVVCLIGESPNVKSHVLLLL